MATSLLDRPPTAAPELRRLPAPKVPCESCGRNIVWATTVAGPNGRGGKNQAFDPYEHPDARVAVYPARRGQLYARALFKDEAVDRPIEYAGMPHAATCSGDPTEPPRYQPPGVADLHAARARREHHR